MTVKREQENNHVDFVQLTERGRLKVAWFWADGYMVESVDLIMVHWREVLGGGAGLESLHCRKLTCLTSPTIPEALSDQSQRNAFSLVRFSYHDWLIMKLPLEIVYEWFWLLVPDNYGRIKGWYLSVWIGII